MISPKQIRRSKVPSPWSAFTIVEMLISMAILSILMLSTLGIVEMTRRVWEQTTVTAGAFREARVAFDAMTRRLSQANLNVYFDYVDDQGKSRREVESAGGVFVPRSYSRQSELHFVSGPISTLLSAVPEPPNGFRTGHGIFFQAPLGFAEAAPTGDAQLVNLLNSVGYFVQYSDDSQWQPTFLAAAGLPKKSRFRLMQLVQGTEKLRVYAEQPTMNDHLGWLTRSLNANALTARPMADNILMLVIWPRTSEEIQNALTGAAIDPDTVLTEKYRYDTKGYLEDPTQTISRNQLPPQVQITVVATDETSATRLDELPEDKKEKLKPDSLFTKTSDYDKEIGDLEGWMNDNKIKSRIFSGSIAIRQAKFSKD